MAKTYKLLRVTADLADDADDVLLQTASVPLVTLVISPVEKITKVEFVLEWVDANDDPKLGGRGSFTARIIRKMLRGEESQGAAGAEELWVDVADIPGIAYRPFLVTDVMKGDELGVLLTSMAGPGGATKARVMYRELVDP
jgi:hypothetical protein